jgi:hypothetical protein
MYSVPSFCVRRLRLVLLPIGKKTCLQMIPSCKGGGAAAVEPEKPRLPHGPPPGKTSAVEAAREDAGQRNRLQIHSATIGRGHPCSRAMGGGGRKGELPPPPRTLLLAVCTTSCYGRSSFIRVGVGLIWVCVCVGGRGGGGGWWGVHGWGEGVGNHTRHPLGFLHPSPAPSLIAGLIIPHTRHPHG